MRITGSMISRDLLNNLGAAQNKLNDLNNKLSSKKSITKPSDDPGAIEKILNYKSGLNRIEQWKKNAGQALDLANTTDSVMGVMSTMLHRVTELAVEGANGTLSSSERNSIKIEIDQIAQLFLTSANTKIGNKRIFAGTKTDTDPLVDVNAIWGGNKNPINIEVGNGINISVSVDGEALFQTPLTKHSDGTAAQGIFKTLGDLSLALGNNDGSAVSSTLSDLEANLDNINLMRADLGARVNRFTSTQTQLESMDINWQQNLSNLQDTDVAAVIVQYKSQESAYNAALSTGAKIMQLSLVDYMR